MRKKILCLILTLSLLLPCLVVFAGALTDEDKRTISVAKEQGFDKFIDVEECYENYLAYKSGDYSGIKDVSFYEQISLLGVDVVDMHFTADGYYAGVCDLYFFNPLGVPLTHYNYDGDVSTVSFDIFDTSNSNILVDDCVEIIGIANNADGLFVKTWFSILMKLDGSFNYEDVAINLNYFNVWYDDVKISFGTKESPLNFVMKNEKLDSVISISSPLYDLAFVFNESEYKVKADYPVRYDLPVNGEIYRENAQVIYLYEQFGSSWGVDKLYLYLYDPYGRGARNCIEIKTSVNNGDFHFLKFNYLKSEGAISKFVCEYDIPETSQRTYDFGYYCYYSSNLSQITPLHGYDTPTYHIEISDADNGVATLFVDDEPINYNDAVYNIKSSSSSLFLTTFGNTSYSLNSSKTGTEHYATLSSVYFTLPEALFDTDVTEYNKDNRAFIQYIKGHYTVCETGYGFVTTDTNSYNKVNNKIKNNSAFNSAVYFGHFYDTPGALFDTRTYDYCYGDSSIDKAGYWNGAATSAAKMSFAIKANQVVPGQACSTNSSVKEQILSYGDDAFVSTNYEEFTLTPDIKFNLFSKNEWSFSEIREQEGFLAAVYAMFAENPEIQDSIEDICAILVLHPDDIDFYLNQYTFSDVKDIETFKIEDLTGADFRDAFFVDDAVDIRDRMIEARDKDEAFILLRFRTFDYYASDAIYLEPSEFGKEQVVDENCFVCKTEVIKGFQIGEIAITGNKETTVYNVVMSPMTFVAGTVFAPNEQPSYDEEVFPGGSGGAGLGGLSPGTLGANLFNSLFSGWNIPDWSDWSDLGELIARISSLISLILVAILVVMFWEPIKSVIGVLWDIISIPFKAIGGLFDKNKNKPNNPDNPDKRE